MDGSNPLDLVRDFVFASGSSADRHGAARRFLAPDAGDWDDAASLTVLDGAVRHRARAGSADPATGLTTIRIRGTALGRLTGSGSFEPAQSVFAQDVTVIRVDGQWRISRLPDGILVPLSILRQNYRTVRTWFVDPVRRLVVADLRYLPGVPARAQAARALELLLAGPSGALQGAAVSQLAARRAAALERRDEPGRRADRRPHPARRPRRPAVELLAAQVVLSLAEVNVARVRLLVDGEPLLPDRPDLTRDDVAALVAEVRPATDVPTLVVSGGRLRPLAGPESGIPVPGPLGDGQYDVESAASTVDGQRLAAVARQGSRKILLLGPPGAVTPVPLTAAGTLTRPTWTPTGLEAWTVVDGNDVVRVLVDATAPARVGQVDADELTSIGPIRDLRLSRDGVRVVAVVDGMLYTAAVARGLDGEVAIRNVRRLRPVDLGEVVAADWRSTESVVAISRGMDMLVAQVSADGLALQSVVGNNLTPPLTALAASSNRALLVTDQTGVWSFGGGDQAAWRQVLGGAVDAVPLYPG